MPRRDPKPIEEMTPAERKAPAAKVRVQAKRTKVTARLEAKSLREFVEGLPAKPVSLKVKLPPQSQ